jgi:beta-phosphoglucomutase
MLKAVIFDCDGVIVNSEPNHLKAFQLTLAAEGIPLTEEEYCKTYLAMDDKTCFETALASHQRPTDKITIKRLIHQKMAVYKTFSQKDLHIYPGVTDLVRQLEGRYKLAVASGAFRGEIKEALDKAQIRSAFPVIVSAQDVKHCKPSPEPFLTALDQLSRPYRSATTDTVGGLIQPGECVVIEDSIHGIMAARAAQMKSIAVTTSYPREALEGLADKVVNSLTEVTPEIMEALCKTN